MKAADRLQMDEPQHAIEMQRQDAQVEHERPDGPRARRVSS
jgi:hypothetical protein